MAEKDLVTWKIGEALKRFRNRQVEKIFWKYGAKREPSRSRKGEITAYKVKQELNTEFALNQKLIKLLKKVEANWKIVENLIWGQQDSIVAYYRGLSFLSDAQIVELENIFFKSGTGFRAKPVARYGTSETDTIAVNRYSLDTMKEIHLEPGGEQIRESLSLIGHNNIAGIIGDWTRLYEMWRARAGTLGDAGLLDVMQDLNGLFTDQFPKIFERENAFQQSWLKNASAYHEQFKTMRGELERLRPKNVRFYHTYKIIAPAIKNPNFDPKDSSKGPEILRFAELYPKFRRDDEVEAGLDENGYPLEVNEKGEVLLDKWWDEISKNPWQEGIIKSKPGGKEIWEAKVEKGTKGTGVRVIDLRFKKELDLLSAAVYIYNEFDAYWCDIRDGRFHEHSKTATDYELAAEGISTVFYEGAINPAELRQKCGKLPFKVGVEPVIPNKKMGLSFRPMDPEDYITKNPGNFIDVPDDEMKVTSNYQIKLNAGNDNGTLSYKIESGVRKPNHLDPAFDRRALNAQAVRDDFFIHWGRMYYYERSEGIKRWSENPFPFISSRGLAKYLMHRLMIDLFWEDAVDAAENSDGYDYGIRKPIVGGEFTTNPLKTTDLVLAANH